jgi:signal recognition particle GTPase
VDVTTKKEMLMRKILIMGLPGAGKTTLASTLAPLLNAVVFKQLPSMMTRSALSRIAANIRRYLPIEPPISSRMRVSADAE